MNSKLSLVAQLTALGFMVRTLAGGAGCEVSRGDRVEFSGTAAQCKVWMGYSAVGLLQPAVGVKRPVAPSADPLFSF